MQQGILNYLASETRPFGDFGVTDVDLLVLSAAMYLEFERFSRYARVDASTAFSQMDQYGAFREHAEHDYHPADTEELLRLLASSPRFGGVSLERFSCVVEDEPPLQFGAACFPISDECVVVAFRGTDVKLQGWLEDFEMTWREAGPGLARAQRYLREAAAAYPQARFYVCGHSKGGSYAEYAAVFASSELSRRIERVCSFDGPSLFHVGGAADLDLEAYDRALLERYDEAALPITRYIFASSIGLLLERRDSRELLDSGRFPFVKSIDPRRDHSVFAAAVVDGAFVLEPVSAAALRAKTRSARFIRAFSRSERKFFTDALAEACRAAGVTLGITNEGANHLGEALRAWYASAPADVKRQARKLIVKAAIASVASR